MKKLDIISTNIRVDSLSWLYSLLVKAKRKVPLRFFFGLLLLLLMTTYIHFQTSYQRPTLVERTGLNKRVLTPKQALIAPSFLSLLLSIEFNSNVYIIHNQISSSSLLLAIIPLLSFRNNYFIFLDGHIRKAYYSIFTPLILYSVVLVISIKKSEPISH